MIAEEGDGRPPNGHRQGEVDENYPAMLAAIERRLEQERGPRAWLRSRPTAVRVGLAIVLAVAAGVLHALAWRRVDWALYPPGRMLLVLGAYAAGIVVTVKVALRPLSAPSRWPAVAVAASMLGLPVVLALLPRPYDGTEAVQQSWFAGAVPCFVYGTLWGATAAAALRVLDRRDGLSSSWSVSSAACAGLLANLLLQIHCPNTRAAHLLAGHAGIGVGWLLLLSGAVLLDRRGRRPSSVRGG
jgi:hypothetical protein